MHILILSLSVNPKDSEVEGVKASPSLSALLQGVASPPDLAVSIITPPKVSLGVVQDAINAGVQSIWLQPGAESDEVLALARSKGVDVIAGGPCLLVALRAGPLD